MLHRRSTATALVAVLLPLAAALTSCGFDYPTDRVNTIAAGVNERDASVDVLGARVVAWGDGHGRLIGTLVYNENDADAPAKLVEVAGEGVTVAAQEAEIEVVPNEHVNLASDESAAIAVEGEFAAGDYITLTYSFDTNESVTLEVPVVKACGQYEGITEPEVDPAAAEETDAPEDAEHSEEADATYLCDHPTDSAEGEEGGH
jgi:hypothetical protein